MTPSPSIPYGKLLIVLFTVQGIFSLWPIFIAIVVRRYQVHPLYVALLRDIIGSTSLWIAVWMGMGCPWLISTKSHIGLISKLPGIISSFSHYDKKLFIALGIVSTINSVGYVMALQYVSPFNSALLHPSIPVFASLFGSLLGVEDLTRQKILGSTLCIIGSIAVVITQSNLSLSGSLLGNILLGKCFDGTLLWSISDYFVLPVVTQSLAMALLLVGQKFVDRKYGALETTAIYYTIGTVFSAPFIFIALVIKDEMVLLNINSFLVILFGGLFVIACNYVGLSWASKVSKPSIPAASMMLQPPLTYILGMIIVGDQSASIYTYIGGIVIIIGLLMTTYPAKNVLDGDKLPGDEQGVLLTDISQRSFSSSTHSDVERPLGILNAHSEDAQVYSEIHAGREC